MYRVTADKIDEKVKALLAGGHKTEAISILTTFIESKKQRLRKRHGVELETETYDELVCLHNTLCIEALRTVNSRGGLRHYRDLFQYNRPGSVRYVVTDYLLKVCAALEAFDARVGLQEKLAADPGYLGADSFYAYRHDESGELAFAASAARTAAEALEAIPEEEIENALEGLPRPGLDAERMRERAEFAFYMQCLRLVVELLRNSALLFLLRDASLVVFSVLARYHRGQELRFLVERCLYWFKYPIDLDSLPSQVRTTELSQAVCAPAALDAAARAAMQVGDLDFAIRCLEEAGAALQRLPGQIAKHPGLRPGEGQTRSAAAQFALMQQKDPKVLAGAAALPPNVQFTAEYTTQAQDYRGAYYRAFYTHMRTAIDVYTAAGRGYGAALCKAKLIFVALESPRRYLDADTLGDLKILSLVNDAVLSVAVAEDVEYAHGADLAAGIDTVVLGDISSLAGQLGASQIPSLVVSLVNTFSLEANNSLRSVLAEDLHEFSLGSVLSSPALGSGFIQSRRWDYLAGLLDCPLVQPRLDARVRTLVLDLCSARPGSEGLLGVSGADGRLWAACAEPTADELLGRDLEIIRVVCKPRQFAALRLPLTRRLFARALRAELLQRRELSLSDIAQKFSGLLETMGFQGDDLEFFLVDCAREGQLPGEYDMNSGSLRLREPAEAKAQALISRAFAKLAGRGDGKEGGDGEAAPLRGAHSASELYDSGSLLAKAAARECLTYNLDCGGEAAEARKRIDESGKRQAYYRSMEKATREERERDSQLRQAEKERREHERNSQTAEARRAITIRALEKKLVEQYIQDVAVNAGDVELEQYLRACYAEVDEASRKKYNHSVASAAASAAATSEAGPGKPQRERVLSPEMLAELSERGPMDVIREVHKGFDELRAREKAEAVRHEAKCLDFYTLELRRVTAPHVEAEREKFLSQTRGLLHNMYLARLRHEQATFEENSKLLEMYRGLRGLGDFIDAYSDDQRARHALYVQEWEGRRQKVIDEITAEKRTEWEKKQRQEEHKRAVTQVAASAALKKLRQRKEAQARAAQGGAEPQPGEGAPAGAPASAEAPAPGSPPSAQPSKGAYRPPVGAGSWAPAPSAAAAASATPAASAAPAAAPAPPVRSDVLSPKPYRASAGTYKPSAPAPAPAAKPYAPPAPAPGAPRKYVPPGKR